MKLLELLSKSNEYRKPFLISLLLYFFSYQSASLSSVYFNTLFLTYYPASWLSYLYIITIPLSFIAIYLYIPSIKESSPRKQAIFLGGLTSAIVITYFFLSFPYVPFFLCLLSDIINCFFFAICTNAVANAFNGFNFKNFIGSFLAIGSFSNILGSFGSTLLVKLFSTNTLLWGTIVFSYFTAYCIALLPQKYKENKNIQQEKISISNFPLAKLIIYICVLQAIIFCLIRYILNYYLSINFNEKEIATYLGLISGTVSLASILLQIFVIKPTMLHFGVKGLFYIPAIIMLICPILFIYHPVLASVIIMNLMFATIYSAYWGTSKNISINVLPAVTRNMMIFVLASIAFPIGKIIGAIFIYICAKSNWIPINHGLYIMIWVILVAAIAYCVIIPKITKKYQITLKEGVKNKRFDFDLGIDQESNLELNNQLALNLLKVNDDELNLLGFSLIHQFTIPELRQILVQKLQTNNLEVKLATLNCIRKSQDSYYTQTLLEQLKYLSETKETEAIEAILWDLILILRKFAASETLLIINAWQSKTDKVKKICWCLLAFTVGDENQKQQASTELLSFLSDSNSHIRNFALKALCNTDIPISLNALEQLLNDENSEVSISTIRLIGEKHLNNFIPILVKQLAFSYKNYYIIKTLRQFKDNVIPELAKAILNGKLVAIEAASRVLVSLNSDIANQTIFTLAQTNNALIKTSLAQQALFFVEKIQRNTRFYHLAYKLFLQSVTEINQLQGALLSITTLEQQNIIFIINELNAKLAMAKFRCWAWLAIYSNSIETAKVVPVVVQGINTANNNPNKNLEEVRYTHAIELFDSFAKNKQSRAIIENLAERVENKKLLPDKYLVPVTSITDPMIVKFINYNNLQMGENILTDQNSLGKVIVLRQVRLFESLAGEVLEAIAEEISLRKMVKDEIILKEGAEPDGLYIIASGKVSVQHGDTVLSILHQYDSFGEIGLIDNSSRTANVIAIEEGILFYLNKATFNNIVVDLPIVLKVVAHQIIQYYRSMLK